MGIILFVAIMGLGAFSLMISPKPKWFIVLGCVFFAANLTFHGAIAIRTRIRKSPRILNITGNRWPQGVMPDPVIFHIDIPMTEHKKGPYPEAIFWEAPVITQHLEIISRPGGKLRLKFRHPQQTYLPDQARAHTLTMKVTGK